jgi:uncharacterized protein
MPTAELSWDEENGELTQSGIRYVLMRPDVVMGAASHLPDLVQYVRAIEASACENARGSFDRYRDSGALGDRDPIVHACEMAQKLGWGVWRVTDQRPDTYQVEVINSPFAAAMKGAEVPVCGWISGVLSAVAGASFPQQSTVHENECGAQGHECCRFEIRIGNSTATQ